MQFIVKNDMQYIQQYNYVYLGSTHIIQFRMMNTLILFLINSVERLVEEDLFNFLIV